MMETQGTGNNQAKDWRKPGLGWIPDYPDERDYYLDNEEVTKNSDLSSNSGNLRRNEVTKSIEDIADNLIELIETLEKFPGKETLENLTTDILNNRGLGEVRFKYKLIVTLKNFLGQETLENLKTNLKSQVFGEVKFVKVKVYSGSLKLGIDNSPKVRQLKYYFHLLSSHPSRCNNFHPREFFKDYEEYWKWLNSEAFDDNTQKIVKAFQAQANIRIDGIVGVETYTAISKFLGDSKHSQPAQDTPLVNLLPIPIWINDSAFEIIFDNLKSWWSIFFSDLKGQIFFPDLQEVDNQVYELSPDTRVYQFFSEMLKNEDPSKCLTNFFEIFKQEFYFVEPLVSAITEMISPFAIQDDVESALRIELNKFKKFKKELKNTSVEGAILKVADRLEIELKERVGLGNREPEKLAKTNPELKIITFYEIILVIVKGYINKYKLIPNTKLLNSFSPPYLFEIQEDEAQKKDSENIIHITECDLLVNRKWYEQSKNDLVDKARKPYAILPSVVDLTTWCSPIRDQGSLNSCTAFAAVALLEYFARKARDEYTYVSPLFLYKVARNLMNSKNDIGASVRETMRAMVAFGVPPEKYWSYETDKFDEEPPAFCYSYAQNYKTLKYFRLDRPDLTKEILLFQIQAVLAADFPCIFGFTVYSSIHNKENISSGCIPYPSKRDQVIGGHTVLAVGYNNYKVIKHSDGKNTSRGALLIRNSWGTEWGQKGYGWLPYEYILKGLTADWWSLIKAEWFEAGNFGLGAHAPRNPNGPIGRP